MTGGIITTHLVEQLDAVALAWLSLAAMWTTRMGTEGERRSAMRILDFYEGSRDELVPLRCLQQ